MNLNNNLYNNNGFFQQTPQKDKNLQSTSDNNKFYGTQQTTNIQFPQSSNFGQKNTFENSNQSNPYNNMYQIPQSFVKSNTQFNIPQQSTPFPFKDISSTQSSIPLNSVSNTNLNNLNNMNQSTSFVTSPFTNSTTNTPLGNSNNTTLATPSTTPFTNSNIIKPFYTTSNIKSSNFEQLNNNSNNNLWGNSNSNNLLNNNITNKGSNIVPYVITRYKDDTIGMSELHNICGMDIYSQNHIDEIRNEDYNLSRKPPLSNNPPTNQSSFGVSSFSSHNSIKPQIPSFNSTSLFSNTSVPLNNTVQKPQFPLSNSSQFNPIQQSNLFSQKNNLFSNNSSIPNNTLTNPISSNNTSQYSFINTPVSNTCPPSSNISSPLTSNSSSFPSLNNNLSSANNQPIPFKSSFQPTTPSTASSFFPQINSSQSNPFSSSFNNQFIQKPPQPSQPLLQPDITQFVSPVSIQPVEYSDPYLIKNIKFENFIPQKPSLRQLQYKPIFNTKKDVSDGLFHIRLPAKHHNSNIYTIPEIIEDNLKIKNLVVIFNGTGKIEYLEAVTVQNRREIEDKIKFKNETVEISDEPGLGFNKRARVFIENLFPYSRASNSHLKGKCEKWPEKGVQERFIYQLKNNQYKKFIDYDCDTGLYVYEVNHF